MAKFYKFTQDIIRSDFGMSVKDVMETDWQDLLAVLSASEQKEKVMTLEEFIGQLG
ncbi:hypothetical protein Javan126_0038 [Streptococcus phage Javan126]|uniref:hypothetical protein n=1 Tax=Streptococcus dysgalactiae TaxID=1334 RepID=UPI0003B04C15|nr:hypothetical protein [Streptococcus dysgalactiae]QBX14318.1 hypothetical protein Javan133_0043 [Streptococcus phage Javan133]QBX23359.1 hypothetical protein Javan126_0038 [Streptococcus phage Javan126]QBX23855.1 hypothetical protein Javan164_0038 [Streptococcus phage Javan164]BAN93690.1 hypothetical protein SDSE167_1302 [Streptococcus dysgalactiae subsp. equisimilis 167]